MNLIYERPDYAAIAKRLGALNEQILAAASFEPLHAAWLAAKAEIEAMEYREEIVYVRHLCGLDYENSTEEVLLQSREDPAIYALRDRCNRNAMQSAFAPALSRLYGAQVFASLDEAIDRDSSDTLRLQTEESVLKTEYRRLMKNRDRDEDRLFEVFAALIETRSALASCAGYGDYIELGYQKINRRDYGRDELARFRGQIQKTVTPFMAAIKKRGAEQIGLPARAGKPVELIDEIRTMFHDLSEETGCFIDDVTQNEMYDLEIRENKRRPLWICCMFPKIKLPFVVGTFSGDGMDTGAAVHEFGHGFAFYTAARSQPLYEYRIGDTITPPLLSTRSIPRQWKPFSIHIWNCLWETESGIISEIICFVSWITWRTDARLTNLNTGSIRFRAEREPRFARYGRRFLRPTDRGFP